MNYKLTVACKTTDNTIRGIYRFTVFHRLYSDVKGEGYELTKF